MCSASVFQKCRGCQNDGGCKLWREGVWNCVSFCVCDLSRCVKLCFCVCDIISRCMELWVFVYVTLFVESFGSKWLGLQWTSLLTKHICWGLFRSWHCSEVLSQHLTDEYSFASHEKCKCAIISVWPSDPSFVLLLREGGALFWRRRIMNFVYRIGFF